MTVDKNKIFQEINLEYQWKQYLKRVRMEHVVMSAVQEQEMRRAFFVACGQMLVLLRDDVSLLPDEDAVVCMQDMMNQIQAFWQNEVRKHNEKDKSRNE